MTHPAYPTTALDDTSQPLALSVEQKIPATIHYCWLGGQPKPDLVLSCLESWATHMPSFEVRCWDESSFDIARVPFVRDACAARKWAFAADYIRLHALHQHGGIYLDTDVRVFKSFAPFLRHAAFSGVEFHPDMYLGSIKRGSVRGLGILSAVLGAQKDHPWIARILYRYQSLQFPKDLSLLPRFIISGLIADVSAELFGFKFLPVYQRLKDDVHIYPPDVFYSRAGEENLVRYSCHMCASSWREPDVTSIGRRAMNLLLRH